MYDIHDLGDSDYIELYQIEDILIHPGRVTLYDTCLRDTEYDKKVTYKNIMLIKCTLYKLNLENKTFESCYFDSCIFESSTENTVFKNCTFYNVTMSDITVEYSQFINCVFMNVEFVKCDLKQSEFELCVFNKCIFDKCNFTQITFTTSHLLGVEMLSNCKIYSMLFNKESAVFSCEIYSQLFNVLAMDTHFQNTTFSKIYENNLTVLTFNDCKLDNIKYNL